MRLATNFDNQGSTILITKLDPKVALEEIGARLEQFGKLEQLEEMNASNASYVAATFARREDAIKAVLAVHESDVLPSVESQLPYATFGGSWQRTSYTYSEWFDDFVETKLIGGLKAVIDQEVFDAVEVTSSLRERSDREMKTAANKNLYKETVLKIWTLICVTTESFMDEAGREDASQYSMQLGADLTRALDECKVGPLTELNLLGEGSATIEPREVEVDISEAVAVLRGFKAKVRAHFEVSIRDGFGGSENPGMWQHLMEVVCNLQADSVMYGFISEVRVVSYLIQTIDGSRYDVYSESRVVPDAQAEKAERLRARDKSMDELQSLADRITGGQQFDDEMEDYEIEAYYAIDGFGSSLVPNMLRILFFSTASVGLALLFEQDTSWWSRTPTLGELPGWALLVALPSLGLVATRAPLPFLKDVALELEDYFKRLLEPVGTDSDGELLRWGETLSGENKARAGKGASEGNEDAFDYSYEEMAFFSYITVDIATIGCEVFFFFGTMMGLMLSGWNDVQPMQWAEMVGGYSMFGDGTAMGNDAAGAILRMRDGNVWPLEAEAIAFNIVAFSKAAINKELFVPLRDLTLGSWRLMILEDKIRVRTELAHDAMRA